MGILFWKSKAPSATSSDPAKTSDPKLKFSGAEVLGMNGAVEVPRPEVTVFEFGSIAATTDKITLAGFCPVSDELEPCRWEILPAEDSTAPQFRVVF